MKKTLLLLMISLSAASVSAGDLSKGLVPLPSKVINSEKEGSFEPASAKFIAVNSKFASEANMLKDIVKKLYNTELSLSHQIDSDKIRSPRVSRGGNKASAFEFIVDTTIAAKEGYKVVIEPMKVSISASTAAGAYYGVATLRQIMEANLQTNKIPTGVIIDEPKYEYRGLMLDPARHFIPVDDVKKYIDVMSRYKFNALHFHLSDDQGWRVEIKKYPRLTEIGSVRKQTDGDGRKHSGFYTQEQLRDIVAYAAKRHIDVIPEIDVPGHSVSVIAAYPFLTCRDTILDVRTTAGVSTDLLCAGNEKVFEYYNNIISEICDIFPSKRFHIGGDEAPMDNWKSCPKCQARCDANGFTTTQELMSYFFSRIDSVLQKKGKQPLTWYELDVPKYPKNAVLYAWRYGLSKTVVDTAKIMGHKVICAPGEHAYFDYPQLKGDMPEVNWGMPILPLKRAYEWDPSYGHPEGEDGHVMGVEATLWSECIKNIDRAFYMTYPRALALSEVGWSNKKNRNWESFKKRITPVLQTLLADQINFRVPYDAK